LDLTGFFNSFLNNNPNPLVDVDVDGSLDNGDQAYGKEQQGTEQEYTDAEQQQSTEQEYTDAEQQQSTEQEYTDAEQQQGSEQEYTDAEQQQQLQGGGDGQEYGGEQAAGGQQAAVGAGGQPLDNGQAIPQTNYPGPAIVMSVQTTATSVGALSVAQTAAIKSQAMDLAVAQSGGAISLADIAGVEITYVARRQRRMRRGTFKITIIMKETVSLSDATTASNSIDTVAQAGVLPDFVVEGLALSVTGTEQVIAAAVVTTTTASTVRNGKAGKHNHGKVNGHAISKSSKGKDGKEHKQGKGSPSKAALSLSMEENKGHGTNHRHVTKTAALLSTGVFIVAASVFLRHKRGNGAPANDNAIDNSGEVEPLLAKFSI
jgi:hypothetical protein